MTVKFLVDAQLPPSLARHLSSLGHEAVHVQELGLRDADDSDIAQHAAREGYVIVTKDEDFRLRWLFGRRETPVVWLRCGNISNTQLKQKFSGVLEGVVQSIKAGETLIEIH